MFENIRSTGVFHSAVNYINQKLDVVYKDGKKFSLPQAAPDGENKVVEGSAYAKNRPTELTFGQAIKLAKDILNGNARGMSEVEKIEFLTAYKMKVNEIREAIEGPGVSLLAKVFFSFKIMEADFIGTKIIQKTEDIKSKDIEDHYFNTMVPGTGFTRKELEEKVDVGINNVNAIAGQIADSHQKLISGELTDEDAKEQMKLLVQYQEEYDKVATDVKDNHKKLAQLVLKEEREFVNGETAFLILEAGMKYSGKDKYIMKRGEKRITYDITADTLKAIHEEFLINNLKEGEKIDDNIRKDPRLDKDFISWANRQHYAMLAHGDLAGTAKKITPQGAYNRAMENCDLEEMEAGKLSPTQTRFALHKQAYARVIGIEEERISLGDKLAIMDAGKEFVLLHIREGGPYTTLSKMEQFIEKLNQDAEKYGEYLKNGVKPSEDIIQPKTKAADTDSKETKTAVTDSKDQLLAKKAELDKMYEKRKKQITAFSDETLKADALQKLESTWKELTEALDQNISVLDFLEGGGKGKVPQVLLGAFGMTQQNHDDYNNLIAQLDQLKTSKKKPLEIRREAQEIERKMSDINHLPSSQRQADITYDEVMELCDKPHNETIKFIGETLKDLAANAKNEKDFSNIKKLALENYTKLENNPDVSPKLKKQAKQAYYDVHIGYLGKLKNQAANAESENEFNIAKELADNVYKELQKLPDAKEQANQAFYEIHIAYLGNLKNQAAKAPSEKEFNIAKNLAAKVNNDLQKNPDVSTELKDQAYQAFNEVHIAYLGNLKNQAASAKTYKEFKDIQDSANNSFSELPNNLSPEMKEQAQKVCDEINTIPVKAVNEKLDLLLITAAAKKSEEEQSSLKIIKAEAQNEWDKLKLAPDSKEKEQAEKVYNQIMNMPHTAIVADMNELLGGLLIEAQRYAKATDGKKSLEAIQKRAQEAWEKIENAPASDIKEQAESAYLDIAIMKHAPAEIKVIPTPEAAPRAPVQKPLTPAEQKVREVEKKILDIQKNIQKAYTQGAELVKVSNAPPPKKPTFFERMLGIESHPSKGIIRDVIDDIIAKVKHYVLWIGDKLGLTNRSERHKLLADLENQQKELHTLLREARHLDLRINFVHQQLAIASQIAEFKSIIKVYDALEKPENVEYKDNLPILKETVPHLLELRNEASALVELRSAAEENLKKLSGSKELNPAQQRQKAKLEMEIVVYNEGLSHIDKEAKELKDGMKRPLLPLLESVTDKICREIGKQAPKNFTSQLKEMINEVSPKVELFLWGSNRKKRH